MVLIKESVLSFEEKTTQPCFFFTFKLPASNNNSLRSLKLFLTSSVYDYKL